MSKKLDAHRFENDWGRWEISLGRPRGEEYELDVAHLDRAGEGAGSMTTRITCLVEDEVSELAALLCRAPRAGGRVDFRNGLAAELFYEDIDGAGGYVLLLTGEAMSATMGYLAKDELKRMGTAIDRDLRYAQHTRRAPAEERGD
jgi:hypothetical protein